MRQVFSGGDAFPFEEWALVQRERLERLALRALGVGPGDEVIVPKPHFVEYRSYVGNHNGELVLVDTNEDFSLNLDNREWMRSWASFSLRSSSCSA